jgi:hypothetical protein
VHVVGSNGRKWLSHHRAGRKSNREEIYLNTLIANNTLWTEIEKIRLSTINFKDVGAKGF